MSGAVEVRVLRTEGSIGAERDAWRELAEERGVPFLTPEWFNAWLDHHDADPFVVVARRNERLCGVLPLVARRQGPMVVFGFAGDRLGDGFSPLARTPLDDVAMARLGGSAIARSGIRWSLVELEHCDALLPWPDALMDGLGRGALATSRRTADRPIVDVRSRSWNEYLAESVARKPRKETRRRLRRIHDRGGVQISPVPRSDAEGATRELFRLHDLRWADRGGSSMAAAADRATISRFNVAAADRGWLRLWIATVDGEPGAAELAWRISTRQTHFQAGFDPAFADLGLGMATFTLAMEDAFDTGATVLDLGRGLVDYKERYMTSVDELKRLTIAPRWSASRAAAGLEGAVRRGGRRLPPEVRARLERVGRRLRRG